MFCTSCGKEIKDGSAFCTECGQKFKSEPSVQPTAQPSAQPSVQPQQQNFYQPPVQPQMNQQIPLKKKHSNWLGLILTFILPIPVAALMIIAGAPLWLWGVGVILFIINLIMQFALFRKGILPGFITVLVAVLLLCSATLAAFMIGTGGKSGQSLKMLFRQPPVEYTQSDLDSYLAKTGVIMSPDRARGEDILTGDFTTTTPLEIDDFFTNEELTAMINASSGETGIFQNVSMRYLGNDRMEVSAQIGTNLSTLIEMYPEVEQYEEYISRALGQKVYMRTTLIHTYDNNFEAEIERFSIGRVPLPVDILNRNMVDAGTYINAMLNEIEGFNVEEFVITSEGIIFKGTIPQEIKRLGYMS